METSNCPPDRSILAYLLWAKHALFHPGTSKTHRPNHKVVPSEGPSNSHNRNDVHDQTSAFLTLVASQRPTDCHEPNRDLCVLRVLKSEPAGQESQGIEPTNQDPNQPIVVHISQKTPRYATGLSRDSPFAAASQNRSQATNARCGRTTRFN